MNTPKELKYSRTHEWVKELDGGVYEVGLTDFAQDALGDLVFVNLPEVDVAVSCGDTVCDVESVKAVSDVYTPISGVICEVNEELLDAPERINEAPYEAWLFRVTDAADLDELLDAEAYEQVCEEE